MIDLFRDTTNETIVGEDHEGMSIVSEHSTRTADMETKDRLLIQRCQWIDFDPRCAGQKKDSSVVENSIIFDLTLGVFSTSRRIDRCWMLIDPRGQFPRERERERERGTSSFWHTFRRSYFLETSSVIALVFASWMVPITSVARGNGGIFLKDSRATLVWYALINPFCIEQRNSPPTETTWKVLERERETKSVATWFIGHSDC